MAVLLADVTGDGLVDTADLTQTKSALRQAVSITNFREDVTVDGGIDKRDGKTVKANLGMQLPP